MTKPSDSIELHVLCPFCGTYHNAATDTDFGGSMPCPGDIAVCFDCTAVAVYDDDLRLRRPTDAESAEIKRDPEISRARFAVLLSRTKGFPR